MDQSKLAGIGNIYSDEILFQVGLNPRRLVSDLVEEQNLPADEYETSWNGRDNNGRRVPSGIYICRLEAAGERRSIRVIFIR